MTILKDVMPDWAVESSGISTSALERGIENFASSGFLNLERGEDFFDGSTLDLLGEGGVHFLGDLLGLPGVDRTLARNYAQDSVAYAPKPKFLFKAEVIFDDSVSQYFDTDFVFTLKAMDRPSYDFEYDEVNMYNFRTKILRTVRANPINMVFYDDTQNKSFQFFETYRKIYSPISTMNATQAAQYEKSGMNFTSTDPNNTNAFSAASSILPGGAKNAIKEIRLYQVFGHGSYANVFSFINPKIDRMELDSLDMEDSDASIVNFSFLYDGLNVKSGRIGQVDGEDGIPTIGKMWGQKDLVGGSFENDYPNRKALNDQYQEDFPLTGPVPQGEDDSTFLGRITDIIGQEAGSYLGKYARGEVNRLLKEKTGLSGNVLQAASGRLGKTAQTVAGDAVNFIFGNK